MGVWREWCSRVPDAGGLGQYFAVLEPCISADGGLLQLVGHPSSWPDHEVACPSGSQRYVDGKLASQVIMFKNGILMMPQIILLVLSGGIIASALYFLWRVAHFPSISNIDGALIGVTMTSAFFLCAYGIHSGRGNVVESSLLFAYVVLCVYQIFTDYLPSPDAAQAEGQASAEPDFPPLPPIIMASYSTLLHMLGSLPSAVHSSLTLLYAAFQTITPSAIISLTFRLFVFYCATRIIPAVRESGARALMEQPSEEESDAVNRLLGLASYFSPSILIAMYTSLLLQHFNTDDGPDGWSLRGNDAGGNVWRWINIAATMSLYAIELYLGSDDPESGLTNHWKMD